MLGSPGEAPCNGGSLMGVHLPCGALTLRSLTGGEAVRQVPVRMGWGQLIYPVANPVAWVPHGEQTVGIMRFDSLLGRVHGSPSMYVTRRLTIETHQHSH